MNERRRIKNRDKVRRRQTVRERSDSRDGETERDRERERKVILKMYYKKYGNKEEYDIHEPLFIKTLLKSSRKFQ